MKDEITIGLRLWREPLLAMNLILPILEIWLIGESLWLVGGAIRRSLLSKPGRRKRK